MSMTEIVAKNIKFYREQKNWYQEELAEKLGVSQKAVSAWETAKSCPRAGVVSKMCELFGCSMTDIMADHHSYEYLSQTHSPKVANILEGPPSLERFSPGEQRILKIYRKLNPDNKAKLTEFATDLLADQ